MRILAQWCFYVLRRSLFGQGNTIESNSKSTQAKGLSHPSKISQNGENVTWNFTTGKIFTKCHQNEIDHERSQIASTMVEQIIQIKNSKYHSQWGKYHHSDSKYPQNEHSVLTMQERWQCTGNIVNVRPPSHFFTVTAPFQGFISHMSRQTPFPLFCG